MYEELATSFLEVYGDLVEGTVEQSVWVVSDRPLSAEARHALAVSFENFGYGTQACGYIISQQSLGANDLRTIIECVDPIILVVADASTAALINSAYRANLPENQTSRLMGRDVVMCSSIEELLQTPEGKQRLWALLKKLPAYQK